MKETVDLHWLLERVQRHLAERGDTCLHRTEFNSLAARVLTRDSAEPFHRDAQQEAALQHLLEQGDLVAFGDFLAPAKAYAGEALLRRAFAANRPHPCFQAAAVPALLQAVATQLNEQQQAAVRLALTHGQVVITGAAGSGKSTIAAVLTDLYRERDLTVTLTAPTGKATRRLEQVAGMPACTLHHLLEFDGAVFRKQDKIATDLLVLDEASMVDAELAAALYRALDLQRTAVVWIGDPQQLLPVGAGCPFRDLVARRLLPTAELSQVHRHLGELGEQCDHVLCGTPELDRAPAAVTDPWQVFDVTAGKAAIGRFVLGVFRHLLRQRPELDVQVLTPIKQSAAGVRELNAALQKLVQQERYGLAIDSTDEPRFYLHDRVIHTQNDYDLGVMNGDVGQVVEVYGDCVVVDFGRAQASFPARQCSQSPLELAYALTVHRSQGSEYSIVILAVPPTNRNLLYVGVSRARESAILVGATATMKEALARQATGARQTVLAHL